MTILDLWLPILLGGVFVWIASILAWAVIAPWHQPDMKRVPDHAAFEAAFRPLGLSPGHYLVPQPDSAADMKSAEYKRRYADGPWVSLTVRGARPNMGFAMLATLVVYTIVCAFVAYVCAQSLPRGAAYLEVFRVAGAAAALGFCFGGITNGIWMGKPARWVLTDLVDAAIYTCIVAGTFAWLWPGLPSA
jgi:hypothetical protein